MTIEILGPGCANCERLEHIVRDVLAEQGSDMTIFKVTDYAQIAAYGVMATPGLAVNGMVKVSGRVPTVDEVRALLAAA